MEQRIHAALSEIEASEDVVILYSNESGSRAWGIESVDSDYDVRFLYLRRPSWYLSVDLFKKPDVIELPIVDELDITGWDLRKALWLFRKSNPPLNEWLGSPIVYRENRPTASRLRALRDTYYSPSACAYHYLHMAKGNFREYLKGEEIRHKKYFYVLRPLLAIRWIEAEYGVVPTEFRHLVESILPSGELRRAIDELIARKLVGEELDLGPRIPVISDFIEKELVRHENARFKKTPVLHSFGPLNELFRQELTEVYGDT